MSSNDRSSETKNVPNIPYKSMPKPPVLNKPVIVKPSSQNKIVPKTAATPSSVSIDIHDLETGRVQTSTSTRSSNRMITLEDKKTTVEEKKYSLEDKIALVRLTPEASVHEDQAEISPEDQEEIDRRNYLQMLADAKATSKNLGQILRKKGNADEEKRGYTLADFMDINNVKRVKFNETDYTKHKKLYMIKTKV